MAISEKWKPVPGMPSHEASDRGMIRNHRTGRVLSGHRRADGYMQVRAIKDGRRRLLYVHRLIAEAFLGPPPDGGSVVHHKNHNPSDNRIENLMWCSRGENNRYAMAEGGWDEFGEDNHRAILSNSDAVRIRKIYKSGARTQRQLASDFGVALMTVNHVVNGRTFGTVTGGGKVVSSRNHNRRFDHGEMLRLRNSGMTHRDIAARLGCGRSTVQSACAAALGKQGA